MKTETNRYPLAYEQPEAEVVEIENESILDGFASDGKNPNQAGDPTLIEPDEF